MRNYELVGFKKLDEFKGILRGEPIKIHNLAYTSSKYHHEYLTSISIKSVESPITEHVSLTN